MYSTEDLLTAVTQLEKVIENEKVKSFQIQISAAIGFSLEFFSRYEAYQMTRRRKRGTCIVSTTMLSSDNVTSTCMSEDLNMTGYQYSDSDILTGKGPISPQNIIARVCLSLQKMNDIILRNGSNYILFSSFVSNIIDSLEQITDMTEALSPTISSHTQQRHSLGQRVTFLPKRNDTFIPPTDILERLMSTFGHFKNNIEGLSRHIDHNIVVLTGDEGYGKSSLACAFAHRSLQLKKYDFIRWIPSDAASCHAEWMSFAQSLFLQIQADTPLAMIIKHVYRRIRKCSYLLILDDLNSPDICDIHADIVGREEFLPVANQHILITSQLKQQWGQSISTGTIVSTNQPTPSNELSSVQRRRYEAGCHVALDIRLRGMTWAATVACLRNLEITCQKSLDEQVDETMIHEITLSIHDTFASFPLAITYFLHIYFIVVESEVTMDLHSFWEKFQQRFVSQSPSPTHFITAIWDIIMENSERYHSPEVHRCVIQVSEVLGVVGAGRRVLKSQFHEILDRCCLKDSDCDTHRTVAFSYLLKCKVLNGDDDEYYSFYPLIQRAIFQSLFPVNIYNDPKNQEISFDLQNLGKTEKAFRQLATVIDSTLALFTESVDKLVGVWAIDIDTNNCSTVVTPALKNSSCSRFLVLGGNLIYIFPQVAFLHNILEFLAASQSNIMGDDEVSCFKRSFTLAIFLRMQLHLLLKNFDNAAVLCNQLLENNDNVYVVDDALCFQIKFYQILASVGEKKYKEAIPLLQELQSQTSTMSALESKWQGRIQSRLATCHLMLYDECAALLAYETSLNIAKAATINSSMNSFDEKLSLQCYEVSLLLLSIGKLFIFFERYSEALNLFNEVLASSMSSLHVDGYCAIGIVESKRLNYEAAHEYFEKGVQVSHSLFGLDATHTCVSLVYHNMGMSFAKKRCYVQALDAYEKCLRIQNSINCKSHCENVGLTLTDMGNVMLAQGDHSKSMSR